MYRKIAVVTGGSPGLGRNAVQHQARSGVDAIITYRTRQDEAETVVADVVAQGGRAVVLPLDVADIGGFAFFVEDVKGALAEHWQRDNFDFLGNNAGIGIHAMFAETSEAQFDSLMNIHLKGPFFLAQALLRLIADGGAS